MYWISSVFRLMKTEANVIISIRHICLFYASALLVSRTDPDRTFIVKNANDRTIDGIVTWVAKGLATLTALMGFYGLLTSLLVLSPGCVEQKCYDDLDCPSPKICNASGRCVYECTDDADCGVGFKCVANRCRPNPQGNITCPDDMVTVAGVFCIDRYEASRPDATASWEGSDGSGAKSVPGVIPWQVVDNATAEAACRAVGKRLCTPEEWLLACEGPDGTVYAYGDAYEPTTCNGIDAFGPWPEYWLFHLMPTGSFPNCTNEWGIYDINGNLWEHTASGSNMTIRGGAFNCSDSAYLHRCDYVPGNWEPSARGFRCCMSPGSEPPSAGSPARSGAVHPLAPAVP